jgi:hypothetical protein
MAASLPELLDRVQEWQTESEAVLKLVSGGGWLVSRRMMPRFTSEMLALYRAGDMKAVDAELLAIYDDDFVLGWSLAKSCALVVGMAPAAFGSGSVSVTSVLWCSSS